METLKFNPRTTSEDSSPSDGENKFIKSVKSGTDIGFDPEIPKKLKSIEEKLKENEKHQAIDEEKMDLMTRRIQALEGGSAGAIGLLERVDEVEKAVRNVFENFESLMIDLTQELGIFIIGLEFFSRTLKDLSLTLA